MHPYLFRIPLPWGRTFNAPSYGFMIMCGFLVCLWLLQRRARAAGLDPMALFDMAVLALLCGMIGARFFYVIHHWPDFADHPLSIVRVDQGGLAFFGGLIGGGGALLFAAWQKKLPLAATLDVTASVVPLGHAFGRMGCFLFGCCFGKVTDFWTAVRFPRILAERKMESVLLRLGDQYVDGSPAFVHQVLTGWTTEAAERIRATFPGELAREFQESTQVVGDRVHLLITCTHSLPVHPTQLYELGYNLLIFAALSVLLSRRRRPGDVAWAYALCYGTARFFNQFLRADVVPLRGLGGLTLFHLIAAGAAAFGAVMLARSLRKEPVPQLPPWEPPVEDGRDS